MGRTNLKEIKKTGYSKLIENNAKLITLSYEKLGNKFSAEKKMKLFEKLIFKMQVNDTEASKRLIRKGAYFDREFFKKCECQKVKIFHSREAIEGYLSGSYREIIYSYTPLAMAVEKKNQVLAKFILNLKNNDCSSDRKQVINYSEDRNFANNYNEFNGYDYGQYLVSTDVTIHTNQIEQVSVDDGVMSLKDCTLASRVSSEKWIWGKHTLIDA